MNDRTAAAAQTASRPESAATPAGQGDGVPRPATAPAQPVDQVFQEEAGRDQAECGGHT